MHEIQFRLELCPDSGAGTNLKVGAPIRKKRRKIFFFGRSPPLFGFKSTISRFGERFRNGQYSLVSFLFVVLLLTVPQCPAIRKSGGTCPRVPLSRRHWPQTTLGELTALPRLPSWI